MTNEASRMTLNDGNTLPALGLGVWQMPAADTADKVADALAAGYRAVDTAMIYGNEEGVGEGLRRSGVARGDVFITTKLWNAEQGYDSTLRACEASLGRLGIEQIDLYLIHWPAPRRNAYVESWRALVELRKQGRVRSIGVSNFHEEHIERIIDDSGVVPAINQIECHPRFQRRALRAFGAARGIVTESYSPLGMGGPLLAEPELARIAQKHGRSPAQVVLRWHLDEGLVAIPKAASRPHMIQNLAIGDFALDDEDRAAIGALDDPNGRIAFTIDNPVVN